MWSKSTANGSPRRARPMQKKNWNVKSFMNNSTAWLDCLAFEESGIKAFGYFGKRSAYLMSKEKDGYNNDEHVFEYRTDNEGNIREITVTTYDGQHQVSSKRIHTISYIDAN